MLIDRHPELFPALPAQFRACAPRLDEQVTEAQRQTLVEAKKALLAPHSYFSMPTREYSRD